MKRGTARESAAADTDRFPDSKGPTARQRIVRAATQLFAEKGFRTTTTRRISLKAGTNIASINYYFRSKEMLYEEVFRTAFESVFPLAGLSARVRTRREWEHALYQWLHTVLTVMFDDSPESSWQRRLFERERTDPSSALPVVLEKFINPMRDSLRDLLLLGLPQGVPESTLKMWSLSVIGQCLIFASRQRPWDQELFPEEISRGEWAAVMARHITDGVTCRLKYRGPAGHGRSAARGGVS